MKNKPISFSCKGFTLQGDYFIADKVSRKKYDWVDSFHYGKDVIVQATYADGKKEKKIAKAITLSSEIWEKIPKEKRFCGVEYWTSNRYIDCEHGHFVTKRFWSPISDYHEIITIAGWIDKVFASNKKRSVRLGFKNPFI